MTRIALLQTDLAIDRPGVETSKYGLSNSERDTLVSALGTSDILICDMNLLREDSYRFLLDIQPDLRAAIERGAGLICLTTRPTIRTSAGTKNVYTWVPALGETMKVQDDLVTKVVYEPNAAGPSFPAQILSSLFATCAFDAASLNGAAAFLVSEDKTPVGITQNLGAGFVMMLPQSEDKKGLLTSVIDWVQTRPKGGARSEAAIVTPVTQAPAPAEASALDEVLDMDAVATSAAATEAVADPVDVASAADLSVPTMDELAAEAEAEGVVDLETAAEPSLKETDEFDASALEEKSSTSSDDEPVATGDDPFSKRLSFDPVQATKAPAPDADRTVFMQPTIPAAKPAAPAPDKHGARHVAPPPAGDPEDFDKAFNLDSPDPFGALESNKWDSEDSPAADSASVNSGGSEISSPLGTEPEADEPVAAALHAGIPRPPANEPAPDFVIPEQAAASEDGNEPPPIDLEVPVAAATVASGPSAPVWMDELHASLPGLGDILVRQKGIRDEIQKLEDEHKTLQAKRNRVDSWSPLVTGEPETFHRAVRNFFGNILSTSTDITHQGLIMADAGIGKFLVLPVTKDDVARPDVGRLLLHALADADIQTKGVIVVNHEREKNALQRAPIEPDLAELARRRDFVVIPSILLYRVAVQHALDADPPNVIDIVQQIYSSAGLVTILR